MDVAFRPIRGSKDASGVRAGRGPPFTRVRSTTSARPLRNYYLMGSNIYARGARVRYALTTISTHAITVFPFRTCTIMVVNVISSVSISSLLVVGSSCFHTWLAVLRTPKGILVMAPRLRAGTECSGMELVPYALNAIGLRGHFQCLLSARRTASVAS
jgi:hypothetical protein